MNQKRRCPTTSMGDRFFKTRPCPEKACGPSLLDGPQEMAAPKAAVAVGRPASRTRGRALHRLGERPGGG